MTWTMEEWRLCKQELQILIRNYSIFFRLFLQYYTLQHLLELLLAYWQTSRPDPIILFDYH
ncbi:hypothetical protein [Cytobacillus kochii]|uniref:hypothetical protein n=1 Tax=Cytobacillus TaxID=2675230 RepID=UPI002787BA55|nr:hypothetical protein [Cytobacillus kochii]